MLKAMSKLQGALKMFMLGMLKTILKTMLKYEKKTITLYGTCQNWAADFVFLLRFARVTEVRHINKLKRIYVRQCYSTRWSNYTKLRRNVDLTQTCMIGARCITGNTESIERHRIAIQFQFPLLSTLFVDKSDFP